MNAALQTLGYRVCDVIDSILLFEEECSQILKKGRTEVEFRRMYQDYDAVVDIHAFYYRKETQEAFPGGM